ncbi:MAG: MnmC family methyltransferase [Aquificaceae bacterium]|nr:MnmC family methyltransferase [Aquificaceae bacterium]
MLYGEEKIEKSVEDYLKRENIKIPEKNLNSILLELKAWLKPSVKDSGVVKTERGDYTLIHPDYGEPYHSLTAGAIGECMEKFLLPSGLLEMAKTYRKIRILDIGFGLGYNTAIAIKKLKDVNPALEIEILSFEKRLPDEAPPLPDEYEGLRKRIWDKLPYFKEEGVCFKLHLGDARDTIRKVPSFSAHAVFHDAFSPYRNPELWSFHFLSQVKRLMDEEGVWVSYSSALPVRKALSELGFKLFSTSGVGRKRGGTVACLKVKNELEEVDKLKLEASPYAIPFLDPSVDREPIEIIVDYRIRVELLKISQGF